MKVIAIFGKWQDKVTTEPCVGIVYLDWQRMSGCLVAFSSFCNVVSNVCHRYVGRKLTRICMLYEFCPSAHQATLILSIFFLLVLRALEHKHWASLETWILLFYMYGVLQFLLSCNAATQQVIKTGEDPATASESLALEKRSWLCLTSISRNSLDYCTL